MRRIIVALALALAPATGFEASPTAAILDSQTVKSAEKGARKVPGKTTRWVTTPASA